MDRTEKKKSFVYGAFVLIAGGLIVKIIGALFKIPIVPLIGKTGFGYFSTAYDVYTFLYVFATSGLAVAVSRLVTESNAKGRFKESQKILRVTLMTFMSFGIVATLVLLLGARQIADMLGNPSAWMAICAIAPAIFFETIIASYSGYFQGNKNMVPTATSQIIVALTKLIAGYGLAWYLLSRGFGLEVAAGGAIFGVTLGTLLGASSLVLRKLFVKETVPFNNLMVKNDTQPAGVLIRKVLSISIPITIGASVLSVTNFVDMALVLNRLQVAGFTEEAANDLFGVYKMAVTIFNLPTAIIVPLGVGVIPYLSEKYSLRRYDESASLVHSVLRLSMLMGMPAAVGIAVMSKPIMMLLWGSVPDDVATAAPLLTTLGPAILCVCLVSITNNVLQAVGRERVPVGTMMVGGVVKIITNYTLVGQSAINIHGAPIGTNLCYAVITFLNLIIIYRSLKMKPDLMGGLVKPGIAAAACGAVAYFSHPLLAGAVGDKIATVIAILLGALVYFAGLLLLRALRREDVILLPKGKKIEKILEKYGLIR